MAQVKLQQAELETFLREIFPQVGSEFLIDSVGPMVARVRLKPNDAHVRPGGTISGPAMFALADVGVYVAVLAMVGRQALAVTTSANIDFMRKPAAGVDLIAEVRILKLGRQLAVADIHMHSDGSDDLVARASMTYALPPSKLA